MERKNMKSMSTVKVKWNRATFTSMFDHQATYAYACLVTQNGSEYQLPLSYTKT
jgi:hypothetical protein